MIGSQLGQYRVVRLLGRGGMGEVYLAEDTRLDRLVAVKVLPPGLASDPEQSRRLMREARAVAALNHPNIVTVHAVEEFDGSRFIVLEYVAGRPLSELLPLNGLPIDQVLRFAVPIADAVGAAHQAGITHRDLKPANVMVADDGRVKVLDFGLATVNPRLGGEESTASTIVMTAPLAIVGTFAYMSPEQAEGRTADARSDVFAIGVMLYEMAAGSRPFRGESPAAILSAILRDQPAPLSAIRPQLPVPFERVVRRCLEKDPDNRYQTAKDVRNDLRELTGERAAPEETGALPITPAARRPRQRGAILGIAVAVIVALVALWFLPGRSPGGLSGPAPFSTVVTSTIPVAWRGAPALSPDGTLMAYVPVEGGRIVMRSLRDGAERDLVSGAPSRYDGLAFSPTGDQVYFTVEQGESTSLQRIATLGGSASAIAAGVISAPAFGGDNHLAFVQRISPASSSLVVAGLNGEAPRTLLTISAPEILEPAISWSVQAGIAAVKTIRRDRGGQDTVIAVIDPSSGQQRAFEPALDGIRQLAWLPDGQSLLVGGRRPGTTGGAINPNQVFRVTYPAADIHPITTGLGDYIDFAAAAQGRVMVALQNTFKAATWLTVFDPPTPSRLVAPAPFARHLGLNPVLAADGTIVQAFAAGDDIHLWRMRDDGSDRKQLTAEPGEQMLPRLSPSGRSILFLRRQPGQLGLWRCNADGTGAAKVLDGYFSEFAFSADESSILVVDRNPTRVIRVPLNGGPRTVMFEPARAAQQLVLNPKISPDGRWVAVVVEADQHRYLDLIATDGSRRSRRLGEMWASSWQSAQWTSDSQAFVFVATREATSNSLGVNMENTIWLQPADGRPARQIDKFAGEQVMDLSVSPDARRMLVTRGAFLEQAVQVEDAAVSSRR